MGNWEDIVIENKFGRAVRTTRIDFRGRVVDVDIVKPRKGDGVVCYAGTAIPIRKATRHEIDGHTDWRPFN